MAGARDHLVTGVAPASTLEREEEYRGVQEMRMLTLSTVACTTRPEINGGDRNLSWTNAVTGGRTSGR